MLMEYLTLSIYLSIYLGVLPANPCRCEQRATAKAQSVTDDELEVQYS